MTVVECRCRRWWLLDGRWWVFDDGGVVPMSEVVGARDDGLSWVSEGGFSILFWLGFSLIFCLLNSVFDAGLNLLNLVGFTFLMVCFICFNLGFDSVESVELF
ncbi:hypothetical protein HanIR_Chr05g0232741 [Helianthus annuus]|nr:hypothetical protein HanIR_Chr05g0232741 [Helianthus annuus]